MGRRTFSSGDPATIALLAPSIFVLHVCEEAPRFVEWLNSVVPEGISQTLFLQVNGAGLVITVAMTAFAALGRSRPSALMMLAWLSFLMFANAIVHLVATAVHRGYSPGVFTAAILYLPYFAWFVRAVHNRFGVDAATVAAIVIAGGLPMFLHGYWIVVLGRRLV